MARKINKQTGFTIVEVLIVLAIASVIMLLVFRVFPTLKRNSANTQRRSDATHLASLISEYSANHAGALPSGYGGGAGNVDISKEQWSIMDPPSSIKSDGSTWGTTNSMVVQKGYNCDPSTNTLSASSSRTFSVTFQVETSGGSDNSCVGG